MNALLDQVLEKQDIAESEEFSNSLLDADLHESIHAPLVDARRSQAALAVQ